MRWFPKLLDEPFKGKAMKATKTWEYVTLYMQPGSSLDDNLNTYGKLGWELVAVHKEGGLPILIFKR
jgi:hypothetical protein